MGFVLDARPTRRWRRYAGTLRPGIKRCMTRSWKPTSIRYPGTSWWLVCACE